MIRSMKFLKKYAKQHKGLLIVTAILGVILLVLVIWQIFYLKWAHSTFENYYKFRGCQKLIDKTDTEATCKLANGQTIKLVKFQGRWFLDGDLPTSFP